MVGAFMRARRKFRGAPFAHLPGDFSLTREEAMNEIIGIIEGTELFAELDAAKHAAE